MQSRRAGVPRQVHPAAQEELTLGQVLAGAELVHRTEKALLIRWSGREIWIPMVAVEAWPRRFRVSGPNTQLVVGDELVVADWSKLERQDGAPEMERD